MELEGAKRCFGFLHQLGLNISVFVSDRHRGIAKWIRETCTNTSHFYDIWHVARSRNGVLMVYLAQFGAPLLFLVSRLVYPCRTVTLIGCTV